jgi:hypothetical protein
MEFLFINKLRFARMATRLRGKPCCLSETWDWTLKLNTYILRQLWNTEEIPVYLHMPSNYTADQARAKSVVTQTFGNEKVRETVTLSVLVDDSKLPSYIILNHKTIP